MTANKDIKKGAGEIYKCFMNAQENINEALKRFPKDPK